MKFVRSTSLVAALAAAGSFFAAVPAGAGETTHALTAVVNSSTDVETSATVSMSCSSRTGIISLQVAGINTLDAGGSSFLNYFLSHGIAPNIGWQLGRETGNVVIHQDATTSLWAGSLNLALRHKSDCRTGRTFVLIDQPGATGALRISGTLS